MGAFGLLGAGEVDVLAVAVGVGVVPLVSELGAVLHGLAVALELALVGHLALRDAEVDRHLDRVEGTGDDGEEKGGDGAGAEKDHGTRARHGSGVLGAEEVTREGGVGGDERGDRGGGGREGGLARGDGDGLLGHRRKGESKVSDRGDFSRLPAGDGRRCCTTCVQTWCRAPWARRCA